MTINNTELIFYTKPDGSGAIDVRYSGETIWMTQANMAGLFGVEENTITYHLKEIYKSGELDIDSTTRKIRGVRKEGDREVSRELNYYGLDAIISVGYRVNSIEATTFRKWATTILGEYIQKGNVIDMERYKQGNHFDEEYFEELLEKIREIRLSERRLYLKITDIFSLSSDYDKTNELTKEFFAFIQNKLHWAITGNTAAEIILNRANASEENMGLSTWKNSPDGKILKTDVTIAKSYLREKEIHGLRLAVSAFLDIAEQRASRKLITNMQQWLNIMDQYLDLNEYPKLSGFGKITKEQAENKALGEYSKFRIIQDKKFIGDFERLLMDSKENYGKTE